MVTISTADDVNENLALLYQQNIGYIRKIAKAFSKNEADVEDLMQEAYLGIEKAAYDYDVEGGASFLTYATYKIWACCNRCMKKNGGVQISSGTPQKISLYRKVLRDYSQEHGKFPLDEYIMEQMHLTKRECSSFINSIDDNNFVSCVWFV